MTNNMPTLFGATGFAAVLLLFRVSLSLGQSSIVSFSDSACKQQNPDVWPSSIIFDAANPECLVVRNDTAIPSFGSLSVIFFDSKESCAADSPILLNYSAKNPRVPSMSTWPQTPPFPHPDTNQSMAFCWDDLNRFGGPTTQRFNLSIQLGSRNLPVRSSIGSSGEEWRFMCALKPNTPVLDYFPYETPLKPWLYAKMFIQQTGMSTKFSIKVSSNDGDSFSASDSSFEQCPPDTCCKTGIGQKSIYFKVLKSSLTFRQPNIVYGKVLSCASGSLMFQTFSDNKCEEGRNHVPWVLKADDTCQKAPNIVDSGDTFYRAQCDGQRSPQAASVVLKAWSDASCTRVNEDTSPSTVTCDSTKCCLVAKRYGVNFLRGGAAQFFASDAECKSNSFMPIDSNKENSLIYFKITGLPYEGIFSPPVQGTSCGASPSDCSSLTTFPFLADRINNIFPRKQTSLFCVRQDRFGAHNSWIYGASFYIGYVMQYTGNGQWSFDVRLFRDQDCKQQIFVDTNLYPPDQPGQMCPTDKCCKVGNSSASFYVRFPSRMITYKNTSDDIYATLLSCDGNAAMFYQHDDNTCTKSSYLPRFLKADGSCSAVPTQDYAIDSFYTASCGASTVPLIQSVKVSAYSDPKCESLDDGVKPSTKTCNLNECCEIRYASASQGGALYARALACSNNVLLFNTYSDSKCSVAQHYMPFALRSDGTCQVEKTGYASFYKASCILAPVSSPITDKPCPKDAQGNICGGSTYGQCVQQKLSSGIIVPICRCVENVGKFDGRVCVSAEVYATVIGALNQSFAEDRQQMDRLLSFSCKDSKTPFKCPTESWVAPQNAGKCQTSMAACALSANAFRSYLQSLAGACSGSTPIFDSILLKCVAKDRVPMAVFACPPNFMRCPDGTCDETCSTAQSPECPAASAGKVVCPGNQLICATSLAECSQKQPWNGCPVNQFQCPTRPGVCVSALKSCVAAPGPCVLLCCLFRCVVLNACAIATPSHIPTADLLAPIPLFPFGAVIFAIQMAS